MAESLVSTILNQLYSITYQEVQLIQGVDTELEKLTTNLQAIQAVLEDAEKRQEKEATVKLWLERLKDVSYDIDDVLDEWNTKILKQDAEKKKKVWCSCCTLSSGICFHQVSLRHDIAVKIKVINVRLAGIANEKNAYNFVSGRGSHEQPQPRTLTTSVIDDVSLVFDREQDTDNIKNKLLGGNNEVATLRTISMVGMGGLGKTTLARLAFNDAQVENHFVKRIWVCVSDPFDDKRIAKEILESLQGRKEDLDGMDIVLGKIRESISGKKILLVLGDVWTEDSTRWEPLKGSLRCASLESRIFVTTRKEKVATVMGSGRADMIVGLLSEEGSWKLFSHLAFSERPSGECKNLEDVGRKIVEKCKGLPLAVKTVGSLLRFKESKEQWQSVLESEMWEIKEVEEGVFLPLLVSYYDLPSVLRQCFSFCAIFSEDYVMEKDELIKLWMAQDFLNETQHKEMEIVGEKYFHELAMRSFFKILKRMKRTTLLVANCTIWCTVLPDF